jgi:WD repeat-containing protein 48
LWDIEAALAPVSKGNDAMVDESSNGIHGSANSLPSTNLRNISSSNSISLHTTQTQGYIPIAAKGHKESVYALAMNEGGTILVSGGTEKVQYCIHSDLFRLFTFVMLDEVLFKVQFLKYY